MLTFDMDILAGTQNTLAAIGLINKMNCRYKCLTTTWT